MNQERYEEHKATIAYGIGHLVRDHEDTPGAVKDYVQPMLEELSAEYEAATDTIAVLRHALRQIRMTAEKANEKDWKHAADWIEGEAGRVLKAITEWPE